MPAGSTAAEGALVADPLEAGAVRERFAKAPAPKSLDSQRWSVEFAKRAAASVESGSAAVGTRAAVAGWEGGVAVPGEAEPVILPPVPPGAAVYSQVDREGRRTLAQFDILIACYTVGGGGEKKATQKMNHCEAFEIMRQACTPEGVVAVADKNRTMKLFVDAAAAGVALLTSRLEVLDPSQIKAYTSGSRPPSSKSCGTTSLPKRRPSAWCRSRL